MEPSTQRFKVIFLGNSSVGKTSIIQRLVSGRFPDDPLSTVGIDYISRKFTINDKTVSLCIWDTAGQERFRSLIPGYLRDSAVVVIVFDLTKELEDNQIEDWINLTNQQVGEENYKLFLVGNKTDLKDARKCEVEDGERLAEKYGGTYFETSARQNLRVDELFQTIAFQVLNLSDEEARDAKEKD